MRGYDAWLERPYVERAKDDEAFEKFCEEQDIDPDGPHAWSLFEDWRDGCLEEDSVDRHEARMEREEAERNEW